MAKRMTLLTYEFIFDRSANLWNHVSEFNNDLSDFFSANGLKCEIITPIEGSGGKGVMLISRMSANQTLLNQKGINLTQYSMKPGKAQKSSTFVNKLTNQVGGKK